MAKEHKGELTPRRHEVQRMPQRMPSPFDEMERMFEGLMPSGFMRPFRGGWPFAEMAPEAKVPAVDVIDREEDILLRAELPGVDKENIDISLSDNLVTIRGETRHEEKEDTDTYYRCEISRGVFSRTVSLPSDVDSDKTKASFKDGVLELVMPKVEKAKRHSIKVQ